MIASRHVLVDATFSLTATGTQELAMVGPFTFWHVTIDRAQNPDLDLSAVTSAEIEFRRYAQGYF